MTETLTFFPTGAGAATNISSQSPTSTAHWDKVDDVSADGDSTRIYTQSTSYLYDLYTLTAVLGSGSITSVAVYYRCSSQYSGAYWYGKAAIKLDGDATVYYGTESHIYGGSWPGYTTQSYSWTTNPSTSSPWTWSAIYTLQFGVAIHTQPSPVDTAKCTQVYMVVTYELEPEGGNFGMGDCMVF